MLILGGCKYCYLYQFLYNGLDILTKYLYFIAFKILKKFHGGSTEKK